MAKTVSSLELSLNARPRNQTLTRWLYDQLRSAISQGRLRPEARLPSSRDFARQYGLSRGTVVNVFERLQAEGYLSSRVGAGTLVNRIEPARPVSKATSAQPSYITRAASAYPRPKPWRGLVPAAGIRPFSMQGPAIDHFPADLWRRLAGRRARNLQSWLRVDEDGRGYRPLREAIADYLAASRGVRCEPDQVIVVSGVQQGLDLLTRFLLRPGEPLWMEDPGYFGATIAFADAGVQVVPVPVDEQGLSLSRGMELCPQAKGVFLTPAHQFPLGMTMSIRRRMAILDWAFRKGAFVIEDDYDSEYRFEGSPVPAMQSLDRHSNVILVGSFNKLLFRSLRIGYVVLPPSLADSFLAFRYRTDFHNLSADQAVLCDFIADGHLARYLRRMRDLYACRLGALIDAGKRHLKGLLRISEVRAGLYTAAFLENGMTSAEAEQAAVAHNIEAMAVDRYTLESADPKALLLGFAAFNEIAIRAAVKKLAAALGG